MQCWKNLVIELEEEFASQGSKRYLHALKVVNFDAKNLYLQAEDIFHKIWFNEHIKPLLTTRLVGADNKPIKVHLSLLEEPSKKEKEGEQKVKITLDPLAIFDLFITAHKNRIVVDLLKEIEDGILCFNPIYIYGDKGCGKSHLLMAIAQDLNAKGVKAQYTSANDFAVDVIDGIRGAKMQEVREFYRKVDVLIIDDVHLLAKKGATQEEFFHTFNSLHASNKQIILSSVYSPGALVDIDGRLVSRFEWGFTFLLEKLNKDELQKALQLRCRFLKFDVTSEITSFLINSFFPNVHKIMEGLNLLIMRNRENKDKKLDLQLIKIYLAEIIDKSRGEITFEKIVESVAQFYEIDTEKILGRNQTREFALPRQISIYLCRKLLEAPFMKIGAFFNRDHSTIISSIKIVEKGKDKFSAEINQICKKLSIV